MSIGWRRKHWMDHWGIARVTLRWHCLLWINSEIRYFWSENHFGYSSSGCKRTTTFSTLSVPKKVWKEKVALRCQGDTVPTLFFMTLRIFHLPLILPQILLSERKAVRILSLIYCICKNDRQHCIYKGKYVCIVQTHTHTHTQKHITMKYL